MTQRSQVRAARRRGGAAALAALAVATTAWLLSGCGQQAASTGGVLGVAPSSPGIEGRRIDLAVTVKDAPDATPTTWVLTCNPNGGTHPNKTAACAALLAAGDDPWAAVPSGRSCPAETADPRTATVAGLWYGSRVTAEFRRSDGCQIARWDTLGPLFEREPLETTSPADGEEAAGS